MAKRGRPNVYEMAGTPGMKESIESGYRDYSERGKVNQFYTAVGLMQMIDANKKAPVPNYDKITTHPGCILEQLGRMEIEGFTDDVIQDYARQSGELLDAGWTQKDVAQALRDTRIEAKQQ